MQRKSRFGILWKKRGQEGKQMEKNKGNFVKGIVTGAVVGATAAMVVEPMVNKNHAKKKNRGAHYFKTMGGNVGNMVDSMISKMK